MITTLKRIIKTAVVSLWRNRWLSLASTLVMVITLIIISVFVSLTIVANKVTDGLEKKIDMAAYLEDTVSEDQVFELQKLITRREDVVSVNYVSKEEALERWKARNVDDENLRDIISEEDNPLPRSLEIKTEDPEDLEEIADLLDDQAYSSLIKELSYKKNKDVVERLSRIAGFISIFGWSLSGVFILISILVIYNTVRLTIFARSEEIDIMRLVGASSGYVRGPFLLEGVAYGIVGTIIASIILYFSFQIAMPWAKGYLGGFDIGEGYLGISFWMVVLMQLLVGILLGVVCSSFAIKKHLK